MAVHQFTAQADAPGVVPVEVPVNAAGHYDTEVTVVPAIDRELLATAEQRGWPPGYFEKTYGSITDDTFVAPERRTSDPEALFD